MQLIEIINVLISRLDKAGIDPEFVSGFMKDLGNVLYNDTQQGLDQINMRLNYLGWENLALDYHTTQLAVACFEANGLKQLEQVSVRWSENHKKAA